MVDCHRERHACGALLCRHAQRGYASACDRQAAVFRMLHPGLAGYYGIRSDGHRLRFRAVAQGA